MTDYYNDLDIPKTASAAEIKKAYRRQASKYHPDKNSDPGAEDAFKRIKAAYEALSDPAKRTAYDRTQDWTAYQRNKMYEQPTYTREKPKQEYKRTYLAKISLTQAYNGTTMKVMDDQVTIPKGVRTGNKLFLQKYTIEIQVLPHEKFKRSQDDLLLDVSIDALEAMTGIEVILTHINNKKFKFNIDAGIQHEQIMKLAGKGMPNPETDRYGDLLVRVNITIPRLTNKQKDAIMLIRNRKSIEH